MDIRELNEKLDIILNKDLLNLVEKFPINEMATKQNSGKCVEKHGDAQTMINEYASKCKDKQGKAELQYTEDILTFRCKPYFENEERDFHLDLVMGNKNTGFNHILKEHPKDFDKAISNLVDTLNHAREYQITPRKDSLHDRIFFYNKQINILYCVCIATTNDELTYLNTAFTPDKYNLKNKFYKN